MSTDIAGLAGPAAQRPTSMASSSSSSSSSNNNHFFDDMAYLDRVVEVEAAKKPRMKWTARRKAESMTKNATKPSSTTVMAKVRPQRSMANMITRAASPPPTSVSYRPPSPTHIPYQPPSQAHSSQPSFTSGSTLVSPSPSSSPAPPRTVACFPPAAPMETLSSDSEPDMPSLFDDLASLDTATSSASPLSKSKAKKKERKNAGLNASMSKLKLLKSSTSLGRSSRSSDSASTTRASISPSESSGSSFTFTRSRSSFRSSLSSCSTNTVTSLATVTTNVHTAGSDPVTNAKTRESPSPQSLPTLESVAQLPPVAFAGKSANSLAPTSHTLSNSSPQRSSSKPPDLTPRSSNLEPSRPAPAPPVFTSSYSQPLSLLSSSQPISIPSASPLQFSSHLPSSPPLDTSCLSSPPPFSSYRTAPTAATLNLRNSSRRYSNGLYSTSSQRRSSLAGRKGSDAPTVDRQGSVSSLAPPSEYRRRRSMAESPCLSIIGDFPVPPDMQLDGNRQLGPGSTDHLVAQLAAVAEHESNAPGRERSAAFLDEYMAFVSMPSSPKPDDGQFNGAQPRANERDGREYSLMSESTTASPTLLTPEVGSSTLAVPWGRPLSVNRNTSHNTLMVEDEPARPESLMLSPELATVERNPTTAPGHSFQPFEGTELVDPLTPRPAPVPPPRSMSRSVPADLQGVPVRRETFGHISTLPGIPLEKSPARVIRLGSTASAISSASDLSSGSVNFPRPQGPDSAASSYSASSMYLPAVSRTVRKDSGPSPVSVTLSPTTTGFPGVAETAPLNIRIREGVASRNASGAGRLRTAAGSTAPLNIARSRTASNSSSDARGGYGYSTSYDRGMVTNIESLTRFNMSGHDVTRIRANSGGARLTSPRPRRSSSAATPSSVSSSAGSVAPTPPGSEPQTPGKSYSTHVFAQPPLPYGNSAAYGQSPSYMQAYSQSSHDHVSTSLTSYGQEETSYNSYNSNAHSSYAIPPSSARGYSGGHSHTASTLSVSVPSSGWYSSHAATSPRSPPRRPSLPRDASPHTFPRTSTSTTAPLAPGPRTRGTPF